MPKILHVRLLIAVLLASCLITPLAFSKSDSDNVELDGAGSFKFSSSAEKTNTIVLFTSQGCSSCPPAEKWLNSYSHDERLWSNTIPLAFHVDYWDYLGWRDPFAKKEFSRLQRNYARQGHVASVYTPGILVNNDEFRQWFYGRREWPSSNKEPGVLSVEVTGKMFNASFEAKALATNDKYELHTAWLGMGITTDVLAGENRGRKLDHDFVVLSYTNHGTLDEKAFNLEPTPKLGQSDSVLVVWITRTGSVDIIQAAAKPV